jgi:hypothetical protein
MTVQDDGEVNGADEEDRFLWPSATRATPKSSVARSGTATRLSGAERMGADGPVADGVALPDVFLEDAFATVGRDGAVPDAFRIDEEPRAADADAQAAGLGAHDGKLQFGAAPLEVIPGGLALLHRRAIGAEAKKEVAFGAVDASGGEAFVGGGEFGHANGSGPRRD